VADRPQVRRIFDAVRARVLPAGPWECGLMPPARSSRRGPDGRDDEGVARVATHRGGVDTVREPPGQAVAGVAREGLVPLHDGEVLPLVRRLEDLVVDPA